jgi:hypothetical protein
LRSEADVAAENRWTVNMPSFNRVVELWRVAEVSEETGRGLNAGSILFELRTREKQSRFLLDDRTPTQMESRGGFYSIIYTVK